MSVSIVVFTRDLRLHDNPALHAAATTADRVVPLFVVDRGITEADYNRPNRAKFLAESLADLDAQLTRRGARLVVRHGHVADEIAALADEVDAGAVHMARDCTRSPLAGSTPSASDSASAASCTCTTATS